jgi:hypothetical protein
MNGKVFKEYETLSRLIVTFQQLSERADQQIVDQLGRNLDSICKHFDTEKITATTLEGVLTAIGAQLIKVRIAEVRGER